MLSRIPTTAQLPGLVIALLLGSVAYAGAKVLALPGLGTATAGLGLGLLLGPLLRREPGLNAGLGWSEKQLLELAIVLLGAGFNVAVLPSLGWRTLVVIAVLVAGTVWLTDRLGRRWVPGRPLRALLAVGCGICGSAAIAATAPLLRRKYPDVAQDAGVAIGVVNVVGAVGIFALPLVATALGLGTDASALVIGGALPAVGHVVASGFILGDAVGPLATLVKMGRVLLLGPVVMVLAWRWAHDSREGASSGQSEVAQAGGSANGPTGGSTWRARLRAVAVPGFIIGFVLFALLASSGVVAPTTLKSLHTASKFLLAVAMFAIGARLQFAKLWSEAPRAVALVCLVIAVQVMVLGAAGLAFAAW